MCATPGVSRAIFSTCARISWVRCSDAESGSWTFTMSRPWSCCGMKPVGSPREHPVRQDEQAAVDQQDEQAQRAGACPPTQA